VYVPRHVFCVVKKCFTKNRLSAYVYIYIFQCFDFVRFGLEKIKTFLFAFSRQKLQTTRADFFRLLCIKLASQLKNVRTKNLELNVHLVRVARYS
jgi:hypothetical protein